MGFPAQAASEEGDVGAPGGLDGEEGTRESQEVTLMAGTVGRAPRGAPEGLPLAPRPGSPQGRPSAQVSWRRHLS